jgi:hypothetical protein
MVRTKFVESDEVLGKKKFLLIEMNENFILETFNIAETACSFLKRICLIKNGLFLFCM